MCSILQHVRLLLHRSHSELRRSIQFHTKCLGKVIRCKYRRRLHVYTNTCHQPAPPTTAQHILLFWGHATKTILNIEKENSDFKTNDGHMESCNNSFAGILCLILRLLQWCRQILLEEGRLFWDSKALAFLPLRSKCINENVSSCKMIGWINPGWHNSTNNPEDKFLLLRDHPPPQLESHCLHCPLSASCYTSQSKLHTKRQNELYSEVWKLFSQSSTDVPALLPCAILPKEARGMHKKQLTKPTVQFLLSLSNTILIWLYR